MLNISVTVLYLTRDDDFIKDILSDEERKSFMEETAASVAIKKSSDKVSQKIPVSETYRCNIV